MRGDRQMQSLEERKRDRSPAGLQRALPRQRRQSIVEQTFWGVRRIPGAGGGCDWMAPGDASSQGGTRGGRAKKGPPPAKLSSSARARRPWPPSFCLSKGRVLSLPKPTLSGIPRAPAHAICRPRTTPSSTPPRCRLLCFLPLSSLQHYTISQSGRSLQLCLSLRNSLFLSHRCRPVRAFAVAYSRVLVGGPAVVVRAGLLG